MCVCSVTLHGFKDRSFLSICRVVLWYTTNVISFKTIRKVGFSGTGFHENSIASCADTIYQISFKSNGKCEIMRIEIYDRDIQATRYCLTRLRENLLLEFLQGKFNK